MQHPWIQLRPTMKMIKKGRIHFLLTKEGNTIHETGSP